MTAGVIVAAAVLVLALAGGFAWRRRDGRLRELREGQRQVLTVTDLGRPLGERATLLQFSSSFCAPCRATRQLLADVAAHTDGVTHLELDVADRLDLVRRLDIRRTPTVFVLGSQGEIARRASGLPRRDQVMAAVALTSGEPTAPIGSDSEHGLA